MFLLIPFAIAAILATVWPIATDGDLYLHLKLGQLISQAGHWIPTDVFSYSDFGRPEETASWLAEWWFWILYRTGGEAALRVFHFVVVAVILALATRRGGFFGACVALVVHHEVQSFRPLIFGELGFALILFCDLSLPVTLAIVALWANLHASVLGIIPVLLLRSPRVGLLAAFATFVNPAGPRLWSYAFYVAQLGPKLGIGEWRGLFPFELALWSRYLLVGWAATRARDRTSIYLVTMAILARRHVAYLSYPLVQRRPVVLGVALLVVFGIWRVPAPPPSIARAAEHVHGNVFNYPGWGSYLVFKHWPDVKVAHTMRLTVHADVFQYEREHSFAQVMQRLPTTQMVMLPVRDPIRAELSAQEWELVYEDEVAMVARRKP